MRNAGETVRPVSMMVFDDAAIVGDPTGATKHPDDRIPVQPPGDTLATQGRQPGAHGIYLARFQISAKDAVSAIGAMSVDHPELRVVVLASHAGEMRVLGTDATHYRLESVTLTELAGTVGQSRNHIRDAHASRPAGPAASTVEDALTEREAAILSLVAAGNHNKQIAWKLRISEDTVKTHLKRVFAKLGVADRAHAVAMAARRGFIRL